MARKASSMAAAYKASGKDRYEDLEQDEVDAFHSQREKIAFNDDQDDDGDMIEYSDEEVMSVDDSSSDEEDEQGKEAATNGGWGSNRATYYDADEAQESDDAREQEEMAVKHQQKHLQDMAEEDFIDKDDMETWAASKTKTAPSTTTTSTNVILPNISKLTPAQRDQLVETQFPELTPLSREYKSLYTTSSGDENQDSSQVKNVAREMYLAALSCYFMLLTDKTNSTTSSPLSLTSLKDHPIMETLIRAREAWRVAQTIDAGETKNLQELDSVNLSSSSSQQEQDSDVSSIPNDEETDTTEDEHPPTSPSVEDKLLDLPSTLGRKRRKIHPKHDEDVDDFADTTMLTPQEMKAKQKRKQSLRFYTSKIDQKSRNHNRHLLTGDEDLPYKERAKERAQRLNEEARLRGLEQQDKLGASDDDENDNNSGNDDYYDMVKSQKQQSKLAKQQAHQQAVEAAREGRLAQLASEVGPDGSKRAINYQIEKNRGLAAKKKSVRNPRVKKRNRYESATKKLKSMRPVYKQPTSAYQGESTGIKKNLKRSISLTQ